MNMRVLFACVVLLYINITSCSSARYKRKSRLKCGETMDVNSDTKFTLSFMELNHHNVSDNHRENDIKLCRIEIWTDPDYLIRAVIHYIPGRHLCDSAYLHVGNDPFRPNTKSLTSYLFCNTTQSVEIVSRDNYLWIVHSHQPELVPDVAEVHIEIKKPVLCNDSMFTCSPVQCVPVNMVCDGINDCDNGRDEYCTPPNETIDLDIRPTDPCFMCDDGTCILPTLPRYHDDWGKTLWYLCDGVWHCLNGTDERKDMCFMTKKSSDLLKCVPSSTLLNTNTSVLMWPDRKCDGTNDCLQGEDEVECGMSDSDRIQPAAILIIVCSVSVVVIVFIICQVRMAKSKGSSGSEQEGTLARRFRRRPNCYRGAAGSMDLLERTRLDTVTEEPEQVTV